MGKNYFGIISVTLLIALVAHLDPTTATCGRTQWAPKKKTCSDSFPKNNLTLVYTDRDSRGHYSIKCCKPGSEADKAARANVESCVATACIPRDSSPKSEICGTRTMGTETIKMEEVLSDHCLLLGGDKKGKQKRGDVAQCCAPDSEEGTLLAQLGAEMDEFPHQAGLSMGCGGTVYNQRYILTAAHCVINKETGRVKSARDMTVQLGTTIGGHANFDSINTKYGVAEVIYHPNYSKLAGKPEFDKFQKVKGGQYYNDVALLKLDRDIVFNRHVKALELAPKRFEPLKYARKAVVVGWGTTNTGEQSPHLQKANFIIRSDQSCFGRIGSRQGPWYSKERGQYTNQYLCVGGMLNKIWSPITSQGDSGGPAICRGPTGSPVLCGITSFGGQSKECAKAYTAGNCKPSVFVEVEHFRDWIEEHAGPQDNSTFFKYKLYGSPVAKNMYNHQVHITSSSGKPCGGTLIAKNVVVTAASCVVKDDKSRHDSLKVKHGLRDLKRNGKQGRFLKIENVVAHEGYVRFGSKVNPSKQTEGGYSRIIMADNYHRHDLAVIKLAESVNLKRFPKLPRTANADDGGDAAVELSFPRNTPYGSKFTTLTRREFKLVPRKSCHGRLKLLGGWNDDKFDFDDNVLCGVERYSGGSTCDRELGGGLICKQGKSGQEDVLCGVQIFRLCEFSVPNAFTNMAKYVKWVDKVTLKKDDMVI